MAQRNAAVQHSSTHPAGSTAAFPAAAAVAKGTVFQPTLSRLQVAEVELAPPARAYSRKEPPQRW